MKSLISASTTVFLVLAILAGAAAAQGVTSSGTDYWLGFMPNGAGTGTTDVEENLFIASNSYNAVCITIPGRESDTILLSPGQIYDFPLANFMTSMPETPTDNAIHISSTSPITVYGYSTWTNPSGIGDSPDGYLGLPIEDYGTEYYTVNFPDNFTFGNMPGEFLIISPYDSTVVTITTAAETKTGRPSGTPWNVTLQKGQTYLVQSPGTDFGKNDLTGSLLKSTKPIAVISGHQISSVPTDHGYGADHLIEMVPSADKWGTQYFDEPMAGKTVCGDYIRILSAENDNQITYNGAGPIVLDSGQYSDISQQTVPMVFTSTNHKRFIVAQYSYSQGYDGDPGVSDPWMVLFTPQEQFEKEMIFRFPTSSRGPFTNYVTFISREDSISMITIDGLPISSYPVTGNETFPNTDPLMGAIRVELPDGVRDNVAVSPAPFGAYQYGFSDHEGYGWPAGMSQHVASTDLNAPSVKVLDTSGGTYNLRFIEIHSRLASVGMIVDSGDLRWSKPSYNYSFLPDNNFIVGDSVYDAKLTVIDPKLGAYAALYAVDRAGKDTIFEYHYGSAESASNPGTSSVSYNQRFTITATTTNFQMLLGMARTEREVFILDMLGRTVARISVPAGESQIEAAVHLIEGIYFARIGTTVTKFEVVQ